MGRAAGGALTVPLVALVGSLVVHGVVVAAFAPRLAGQAALYGTAFSRIPAEDVIAVAPPSAIERHASERTRRPPAEPALARFDAEMRGRRALLRRGQGYYAPVASWHAGSARYYRVAYAFVYPDGTYESGLVPWPVTFAAGSDPFAMGAVGDGGRSGALSMVALPAPPSDYLPPGTLGRALRAYFPHLTFED